MVQEGREATEPAPISSPAGRQDRSASGGRQPRAALRSRWLRACIALGVAVLALLLAFAADRVASRGRVLRGVWIGSVALSGLTRDEAREALAAHLARLGTRPLDVRVGSELVHIEPRALGLRVEVERTLDAVLEEGRRGGLVSQLGWWLERWVEAALVVPRGAIDEARLRALVPEWERVGVPDAPFPGAVTVREGQVNVAYPRRGRGVDLAAAHHALEHALLARGDGLLELPLAEFIPSLDRALVEQAGALAKRVLSGGVELSTPAGDVRLTLTSRELGELLRTRERRGARRGAPQLELYFDPDALEGMIEPLRAKIEHPPVNARFDLDDHDQLAVIPSEPGVRLDPHALAESLLHAAAAPGRAGPLPLDRSELPNLTTEEARSLGIRRLVSQFSTYHPCCKPRVQNIHRIADLLDGTVVRPGQTFSVNEFIGPRTRKNGFVPAPTIEDGEMVDSLGGGISQFATTLFNAVFRGGYDIIERQPHSYYFSRYPMGSEATLSYPKPDIIFRNDTAAGMLIRCEYGEKFIRVKIYGENGGRQVDVKVSDQFDVKRPPVELLPDPSLDPEEEKLKESGTIGWSVIVSRTIMTPDGARRDEKRKVIYNPRVRRVRIHPCRIPKGEPGHTGERCPIPDDAAHERKDRETAIPEGISPDSPLDEGF